MAINLNGALFETSNSAIKITSNSVLGFNTDTTGIPVLSSRPYFVAHNNSGWNTYTTNNWNTVIMNLTYVNNGNHYNTTTGRFTAPVAGSYYFEYCTYGYKNPSSNADSYTHPLFLINGSFTARKASSTTDYRLRSRTYYSSTYSWDQQINDIFFLSAGDYVQPYIYCSGTQQWYGQFTHFTGFYLG